MRVAIFGESYLPYLSGVTVSTDALARGLGAAGHSVMVVAPRPARGGDPGDVGAAGPAPQVAWLPSYQLPGLAPPGYRMPWPLLSGAALREVVTFRPDVVHAQSPFVSGRLAARLARRVGVPLVFTHHTRFADYGHYLGPLAGPGSIATSAYLRRFWASCAAIVAPSADLAGEIAAQLGSRNAPSVVVIPTGIDVAGIGRLAAIDARLLAGWPMDSVVVASLGRLAPEKSVFELVEAFARAANRDPRLRLLLVGGGPSEVALRRRAATLGRVHLTGPLSRLDALALLKGADLFAFASRTETQGLVLAEALACGLPVVARAGPAVQESVRDGTDGLVVATLEELAAALGELAQNGDHRGRMAAAAAEGAERFDAARRIAELEALYGQVIRACAAESAP